MTLLKFEPGFGKAEKFNEINGGKKLRICKANKRNAFLIFLALSIIVVSFLFPSGSSLRAEEAGNEEATTVNEAVYEVVSYYRECNTELDHWEELVALKTAGVNLNEGTWQLPAWDSCGPSATDYAGCILGLLARGEDPGKAWAENRNLPDELAGLQQGDGSFGEYLNETAWAMIALDESGGVYDMEKAVKCILSGQDVNGGFGFWGDLQPDDTAVALLALSNYRGKYLKNGVDTVSEAVYSSLDYLAGIQDASSAGFAGWGTENANSIAAVISGLTAVGEDITAARWVKNGKTMVDALLDFRLANGSFYYAITPWSPEPVTDDMATRQALKALAALKEAGYGDVPLYTRAAAPAASPPPGQVNSGTAVSLSSATTGAKIYYTMDNNMPGPASSEYTQPIIISNDVTITAVAAKENMLDSKVAVFNYTLREPGGGSGVPADIVVSVSIIGKNTNHFTGNVKLSPERANVLEALKATGVSYQTRDNDAYVLQIAGEREDLATSAGWKYTVNSMEAGAAAKNYTVKNGDSVVWFWVDRYDISQPGGGTIPANPPSGTENTGTMLTSENFQELMTHTLAGFIQLEEKLQGEFSALPVEITVGKAAVVGEEPMTDEEKEELVRLLGENLVNIRLLVTGGEGALITDELSEVTLKVGAGALPENREITVEEAEGDEGDGILATHTFVSPQYRFGPGGTVFAEPVLLSIRLVIPADIAPENLVLAWFDETRQQWFALPTVVDVEHGFISAEISHFTKFAVLARERAALSFNDVSEESCPWAAEQISYLATRGIVKGVGEGLFEPEREITRAEFTALVVNALDLDTGYNDGIINSRDQFFADVKPREWFAPYINAAAAEGLVRGAAEGLFKPQELITREQMAAVLSRAFAAVFSEDAELAFSDAAEISVWARPAVKKALARGLLKGFDDGAFKPGHPVTRAQAAAAIYRLLLE